ncbi:hypothetical protein GCM10023146_41340 [Nocardioides caricicola]
MRTPGVALARAFEAVEEAERCDFWTVVGTGDPFCQPASALSAGFGFKQTDRNEPERRSAGSRSRGSEAAALCSREFSRTGLPVQGASPLPDIRKVRRDPGGFGRHAATGT